MSERYREITDGTITVPLILLDGLVPDPNVTQTRDPNITRSDSETSIIAESHSLYMTGSSTKELAVKCQKLIKLLRQAMNYKKTSWQKVPVYIKEKLACESEPRYALCLGASGLNYADLFHNITEFQHVINRIGITLIREHPWRSGIPGVLSGLVTLTGFDGPATGTLMPIPNFRDSGNDITHIFNYDATGVGTFSANLAGTGSHPIFSVGGAMPAVGDCYYFGSTLRPLYNVIVPIAIPGNFTADLITEYGNGGGAPAFFALTDGSELTRFPTGADDDLFKIANVEYAINVYPPTAHAQCTINGVSAWWYRVRVNAVTAWAAWPVTDTQPEYASRRNLIDVPNTAIDGDANAISLLRMFSPTGGGTSPVMGTASRIIIGSRSQNISAFFSNLNLGTVGIPFGWATVYDADTAAVADVQAPGGSRANCTFAVDSTLIPRITLTGTNYLDDNRGRFKAFLRCQQIGGSDGDCRVQLRTMIGGTAAGYPLADNEIIALQGHDLGWELVDLTPNSFLNIPFAETEFTDELNTDLIFIIRAERIAGASTLRFADLVLIPIDEWYAELRDPISDVTSGGSALRGDTTLDLDGGIISDRCIKYIGGSTGTLYPSEYWPRSGENLQLRPETRTRLYFLFAHYPTTFGTGPLISEPGMQLFISIYSLNRYNILGNS